MREANWERFSEAKVARNAALRATGKGAMGDSRAVRRAQHSALTFLARHFIPFFPEVLLDRFHFLRRLVFHLDK